MKVELCTPEEIERFRIDHPVEVERILRDIMRRKALVTAYSENNRDFVVTTLIGIDPANGILYLGAGPDRAANRALGEGSKVAFNTAHDQVRVLFTTPPLSLVEIDGETALRAEMPGEILRFQRREYYRLPTPMSHPVKCLLSLDGNLLETTVVDISIGGLGVLSYSDDVMLREGDVHHGCRLSIPETGTYSVSLRVRAIYDQSVRNGVTTRRVGCQFIDLAPSVETDIQRYIIRIERERRSSAL